MGTCQNLVAPAGQQWHLPVTDVFQMWPLPTAHLAARGVIVKGRIDCTRVDFSDVESVVATPGRHLFPFVSCHAGVGPEWMLLSTVRADSVGSRSLACFTQWTLRKRGKELVRNWERLRAGT